MQINTIIYIIAFIFGAIMGSFLNVVIIRLKIDKEGRSSLNLSGRSKCPLCKKILTAAELIPIVSFFILGGKCKNCHKNISYQYPIVEFLSGVLTILPLYFFGFLNLESYLLILIFYFFILIFFYDLNNFLIADTPLIPLFLLILIFDIIKLARGEENILNLILGALIGGGLFLILVLVSKEKWMGWGDVKLGFLLGFLLGYPVIIVSHMIAFISGAIVSLILIILTKRKLKSEIPFAPFLILGALIAVFFGEKIINWYLKGL